VQAQRLQRSAAAGVAVCGRERGRAAGSIHGSKLLLEFTDGGVQAHLCVSSHACVHVCVSCVYTFKVINKHLVAYKLTCVYHVHVCVCLSCVYKSKVANKLTCVYHTCMLACVCVCVCVCVSCVYKFKVNKPLAQFRDGYHLNTTQKSGGQDT